MGRRAVLTTEDVVAIHKMLAEKQKIVAIAKFFGVSVPVIYKVINKQGPYHNG